MGWGGGLILPNAQKSAATPTHPLLASDVGVPAKNGIQAKVQLLVRSFSYALSSGL